MEATIREARLTGIAKATAAVETESFLRYAQNNLLSELPGIAFGLITLVYLFGSLARLL